MAGWCARHCIYNRDKENRKEDEDNDDKTMMVISLSSLSSSSSFFLSSLLQMHSVYTVRPLLVCEGSLVVCKEECEKSFTAIPFLNDLFLIVISLSGLFLFYPVAKCIC